MGNQLTTCCGLCPRDEGGDSSYEDTEESRDELYKIGLPGKLILRDYFQENTRSMFYKGWLIRDAFLELVNFSRILRDGH